MKSFGIFRPTEITGDIVIYSKWCVKCQMPEKLLEVNMFALHRDLEVQVIRTVYRPADHQRATELWACREGSTYDENPEDYETFVLFNGKIKTFTDFIKYVRKAESKSEGKKKNDVQRLPKAKRSSRKASVAVDVDKDKGEGEK